MDTLIYAAPAVRHLRRRDSLLRPIVRKVGPFTLRPQTDRFQVLAASIISQQISTRAAAAIQQRLLALIPLTPPSPPGGEGGVRGKFEPQSVLRLSTRRLRGAGLSAAKAKYLLDLARRVNRGDIDLDGIHELDDEQVIASLTQVHGVGRWTAEMFLIFSLGRPDVLPIDDFGLRSGIQLCDGLPTLPTRAAVRQRGDCWKPYRSVATWYLWQWLRLLRQEPPLK